MNARRISLDAVHRIRRFVTAPRTIRVVLVLAAALIGGWLGLLVGGTASVPVGPVETRIGLQPSLTGGTDIDVPPLGSLALDTHDGPLGIGVNVTSLDLERAQLIVNDPSILEGLGNRAAEDVRSGLVRVAIRGFIAATLGALVTGLIVWRGNWRRTLVTGGTAAAVTLASIGVGLATWNPRAVAEPRYSGLLASAPSLIGHAQSIVRDFGHYERELAKLVTNVTQLYEVTSNLPAPLTNGPDTIRVLHVSDIHLNPAAWTIMRTLIEEYDIAVVVDSGDLTDHGTAVENAFVEPISTLGVPYVFVRGNHDSRVTQAAVANEENAVVLDDDIREVAGLRFIGAGDPRFTPDRATPVNQDAVRQMGAQLAALIGDRPAAPPHVAVVHDPDAALPLDGSVPLVLAGHTHRRSTELLPEGTRLFIQGSTGGAGLRALETEEPTPIMCSVLYFDRSTKRLQAWDDLTLGGLGQETATITRHLAEPVEAGATPSPTPGDAGEPTGGAQQ